VVELLLLLVVVVMVMMVEVMVVVVVVAAAVAAMPRICGTKSHGERQKGGFTWESLSVYRPVASPRLMLVKKSSTRLEEILNQ
jgi:hypothetical protein